jgi:hypothetical protein
MKNIIKTIITDFHERGIENFKKRDIDILIDSNKIITLIGPRRAGKTYILYQLMEKIKNKNKLSINDFILINFEDERLDFKKEELNLIIQAYKELFPEKDLSKVYFFFDEIQEVEGWEKFVRRIYDTISKNIYITGSSSKLLSKEIATSLRGRTLTYEIFPLSFKEYLNFKEIKVNNLYSTKNKAIIFNNFESYLFDGGFPEIINYKNIEKIKILQTYLDVMIFRDLIERYKITNTNIIKLFVKKGISNIAKEFSINKLYNELKSMNLKISREKLYTYSSNLEDIYLLLFLNKFDKSLIKQEKSFKKIYAVDTGIANANSFKFSEDKGRLLENLVFIELKRRGKEIFYHKNKKECDFVIKKGLDIVEAIQVTQSLSDFDTRKRELQGIVDALKTYNLKEGLILTEDEEFEVIVDEKGKEMRDERREIGDGRFVIKVKPIWKWLLE